jgi:protein tyrosine phosphatase (PTP) superfamily phosphohydrolase (DUF442 family)
MTRSPVSLNFLPVGNGRMALLHRPGGRIISGLAGLGCARVVTLLSDREGAAHIGAWVQAAGLAWTWLPLENANSPTGEVDARLRAFVPVLSGYLDAGESVLIHCSAGQHRTGMLAYGLLRWRGLSASAAWEALCQMRPQTCQGIQPRHIHWGDTLATDTQ